MFFIPRNPSRCSNFTLTRENKVPGTIVNARKVVLHPKYKKRNHEWDFCLIQIDPVTIDGQKIKVRVSKKKADNRRDGYASIGPFRHFDRSTSAHSTSAPLLPPFENLVFLLVAKYGSK